MQFGVRQEENLLPLSYSSVLAGPHAIYASSIGGALYEMRFGEPWAKLSSPLQDGSLTVNRITLYGETLYACTDKGLYAYTNGEWEDEDIAIPCYQYRVEGGCRYAATAYGLLCDYNGSWGQTACSDKRVYDFLNLPQFLIIGHENGLSLYDRMTDSWAEFPMEHGVTSLALYKGRLLGTNEIGEWIVGNGKGGFERVRFGSMFIYSVVRKGRDVFACTDKGLYRACLVGGRPSLFAYVKGGPIIDIDTKDGRLYMATLYNGIKMADV